MENLDLYDRKILHELDIDSRSAFSTISKKVKLPKETVNYRVKRLVKNGYIKSMYTMINSSLLGFRHYMVFLSLTNATEELEKKIIDYLEEDDNCMSVLLVEGKHDLVFMTAQKKTSLFNDFMEDFLSLFGEHVHKKAIHRMVKMTKINSKLFYRGEKDTVKSVINLIDNQDMKLDPLDAGILKNLSKDSRMNVVTIAENLKSEKSKILYRIRRMQKNGIIVSYNISTELEKIRYFSIYLCVSLKKSSFINSIIDFFDKYGVCIFAYSLLGEYDVILEIYLRNPVEQREIIKKFKLQFQDHVIDTMILTIYRNYAFDWIPIDEKN